MFVYSTEASRQLSKDQLKPKSRRCEKANTMPLQVARLLECSLLGSKAPYFDSPT